MQTLYMLAGAGFLFAVISWMLFRNRPSDHPLSNEQEQQLVGEDDEQADDDSS